MNSRERLNDIANLAFSMPYPHNVELNASDAAALRELDQLLADITAFLPIGKQWAEGEMLIERLRKAGYE